MTRQRKESFAAISVKLEDEIVEREEVQQHAQRARAVIEQFARDVSVTSMEWDGHFASLILKGTTIGLTQTAWEMAQRLYGSLLADRLRFRIGIELGESESEVRGWAESLAIEARCPGIALFVRRFETILDPPWNEIEVAQEIAHYPAIGEGAPGAQVAARELGANLGRYVARHAATTADLDPDGFLRPALHHRSVGALVRERSVLILGEPWLGKTWIADGLFSHLRKQSRFAWKLTFERDSDTHLPPDQWERWLRSNEEAYVVVDALDEGFVRDSDQYVASRLQRLHHVGEPASRLHVLAFSRLSHHAKSIEALGWSEGGSAATWYLMPLDAENAARALARGDLAQGQRLLEGVRKHVRRLGDNALVRDYYVLSRLAETDEALNLAELEYRVIETLCATRGTDKGTREERVHAATRIAAVLHFSGVEVIDIAGEHGPAQANDGSPVRLLEACSRGDLERAAQALARSDLFEHEPGYGYRFRQHFAKERLAAYALGNARLDLVRRLVGGARGGVMLEHRPVVNRLIAADGERRPALRVLASEKPRPLREDEARQALERILEAAGPRSWHLQNTATLSSLSHPSIATRIVEVLQNVHESEERKRLSIDIARANAAADGWERVPEVMLKLAFDVRAGFELRLDSVLFICRSDSARALRPQLDALLEEPASDGSNEEEREVCARIRAVVLTDRLERGASVLEVAAQAPKADPSIYDSRTALLKALGENLSDDEARQILDQLFGLTPKRLPDHVLAELEEAALQRLANIEWIEADVERVRIALDRQLDALDVAIQRNTENATLRRRMFVAFLERQSYRVRLRPEDADWLVDYVEKMGPDEQLGRACYGFLNNNKINEVSRARLSTWLEANHSELIARLHAISETNQQTEQKWRDERIARAGADRAKRRMLSDLLEEALNDEPPSQNLIWWLGSSVFDREGPRQSKIVGRFEDMTFELRGRLMRRLAEALRSAQPTPVPTISARSFPSLLVYEATAFGAAVLGDDVSWLNGALVRAWLPSVLFVPGGEREPVIAACHRVAERETQDVVLEALRRDATGDEYSNTVQELPQSLVQEPSFLTKVIDIAASAATTTGARQDIVFKLASRIGRSLSHRLARVRWPGDAQALIAATISFLDGGAGIEAVLEKSPPGAVPKFLEPLYRYPSSWSVDLDQWQSVGLAALASWLVERFPFESDPLRTAGAVILTPEHKARELRDQVLSRLMARQDGQASESLDRMASLNAPLKQWLDQTRRARAIDRILAELDPKAERPRPAEIAAMLEAGAPSQLRGDDDLYYVLLETLEEIAKEAGRDADMVWREPERGRKNENNETRLRQYVRTRLRDLLGSREVKLRLLEEDTERYRDRPDLIVTLVQRDADEQSTETGVAIEIKWSHDARVCDDVEKLAERYIVDQDRTHGIYVVGFTGRDRNTDREELERKLRGSTQALELKHPGIRVGLVVLPIQRPRQPSKKQRSRSGARSNAGSPRKRHRS